MSMAGWNQVVQKTHESGLATGRFSGGFLQEYNRLQVAFMQRSTWKRRLDFHTTTVQE